MSDCSGERSAAPARADGEAGGLPRVRDRPHLAMAIAVGLFAVVGFLPVVNNGFVERWDDQANFLQNENFRGLGWPQIRWAWTSALVGVYQPLGWILLEAEYAVWGLEPWGYHVASIAMHATVAMLLYLVTHAVVSRAVPGLAPNRRWAITVMSGLTTALYAAHPLRVEVVAWASCQSYLPCVTFALLSVLAYLRAFSGKQRDGRWFLASVVLFAIALMCKVVPVGLPVVLLILDAVVLGRMSAGPSRAAVWVEKVPYFVLSLVFSVIAICVQQAPPGERNLTRFQIAVARTVLSTNAVDYYLQKTICPLGLTAYHFPPEPLDPLAARFIVRFVLAVVLGLAAFQARRRWPAIPAAALAYLALLSPNLGIIPHSLGSLVADRYSYLTTMPLFVLAAVGLVRAIAASSRPAVMGPAIGLVGLGVMVLLIPLTWMQSRTWHDSNTLRAQALRVGSGRDALLESNLGIDLFSAGRIEEGMAHLHRAIALDPTLATAHAKLGQALFRQGNVAGAIVQFEEEVRLAPTRPEARVRLGMALSRDQRFDESAAQIAEGRRLQALEPARADPDGQSRNP